MRRKKGQKTKSVESILTSWLPPTLAHLMPQNGAAPQDLSGTATVLCLNTVNEWLTREGDVLVVPG